MPQHVEPAEFIESRISLISKSGNRYVGTLVEINSEAGTVSLGNVRVFGTEGRNGGDDENPPSDVVCEQIVFRASDLKDLRIEELANEMAPPAMSQDPTIIASLQSQSRKDGAPQEQQRQQYATVSDASITTTVSHIVCVGAVYIDTIWTVPHFPKEDTKLRAQQVTRRRGGNPANTLEVLSDILRHALLQSHHSYPDPEIKLHLISVLPDAQSQDAEFIRGSIREVQIPGLWRNDHQLAASSMIIQSKQDDTRTIVSHGGDMPEMTCEEFITELRHTVDAFSVGEKAWIHFEGRAPEITTGCVRALRGMSEWDFPISVECEKPDRKGLDQAAELADVVFYSELWAEELYGDADATSFLHRQVHRLKYTRPDTILVCTWGAQGAAAVKLHDSAAQYEWAEVADTWHPPGNPQAKVVDTIGAGDTFIAGMLYQLAKYPNTPLSDKLRYAVQLASRKVYQDGFHGLGKAMHPSPTPS